MKICHIAIKHNIYSDSRIVERMANSSLSRNKVTIITSGEKSSKKGGLRVINIGTKKNNSLLNFYKVFVSSLKINADIYHLHEVPLILIGILLKLFGKKIIMDFHEDFEAELFDKPYLTKTKAQIIKFLYKPLKIVSLIMFDRIILAEESYKKKFINLFNKIEVIKNFPVSSKFKFKNKTGKKKNLVVYVGVISADRGIKELINAVIKFNNYSENCLYLDLIGPINDEDFKNYILSRVDSSNGEISWLGKKKYSEILSNLTNYDIGFSALHDKENYRYSLPTKILEYGSAGLYSIASDLPITHEYIREGLNGSIVKPNDSDSIYECFVEIIPKIKDNDRENIRKFVSENFSWDEEYKKLENLYLKI